MLFASSCIEYFFFPDYLLLKKPNAKHLEDISYTAFIYFMLYSPGSWLKIIQIFCSSFHVLTVKKNAREYWKNYSHYEYFRVKSDLVTFEHMIYLWLIRLFKLSEWKHLQHWDAIKSITWLLSANLLHRTCSYIF